VANALCLSQVACSRYRVGARSAPQTSSAATSERRHMQFRVSYVKKKRNARVKGRARADGGRWARYIHIPRWIFFISRPLRLLYFTFRGITPAEGEAARERCDLHLVSRRLSLSATRRKCLLTFCCEIRPPSTPLARAY